MLPNPDSQNILSAVHGDAQNHIGCFGHIAVILFDLVMDGIHEDEGVDTFQRPILPSIDLRHDLLGNFADQFRRDFHIIQSFDLLGNIPLAHAAGVQRQNFVFHTLGIAVIRADDFRLEVPLAIPGNLDVDLSQLSLDCFLRVPIAIVGRSILLRRTLAALPAQLLVHLHFHDLLDNIPEHFLHGFHDVGGAGEVLALNILLQ